MSGGAPWSGTLGLSAPDLAFRASVPGLHRRPEPPHPGAPSPGSPLTRQPPHSGAPSPGSPLTQEPPHPGAPSPGSPGRSQGGEDAACGLRAASSCWPSLLAGPRRTQGGFTKFGGEGRAARPPPWAALPASASPSSLQGRCRNKQRAGLGLLWRLPRGPGAARFPASPSCLLARPLICAFLSSCAPEDGEPGGPAGLGWRERAGPSPPYRKGKGGLKGPPEFGDAGKGAPQTPPQRPSHTRIHKCVSPTVCVRGSPELGGPRSTGKGSPDYRGTRQPGGH
ncbi:basic proline-rich protein-like [Gracilinanus agilis]|uniref:basic proline-rich protein-like n=1 Tax=Gracilinanus agilis TaxID=191870 RepID=UPI001CFCCF76|nr:basic proline-rich protein-like [Gracilinanus agilis]